METNKQLIVGNIFAGPGAGKSTTMAGVFNKLKKVYYNVELCTEYAKDVVYDNSGLLADQLDVFAHQHRRLKRLVGTVDIAITDSPLLLSAVYNREYPWGKSLFNEFVIERFSAFDNINFYINRKKDYVAIGREQTEAGAIEVDAKVKSLLNLLSIPYIELDCDDECEDKIVKHIVEHFNVRMSKW